MRARALALLIVTGLVSCGPRGAATRTPEATEPIRDPELLAVADAVDPGPQKPLLTAFPAAESREEPFAAPGPTAAIKQLRAALLAWDQGTGDMSQRMRWIADALVLGERAVAAGSDDAELLLGLSRVYELMDLPHFDATWVGEQYAEEALRWVEKFAARPGGADRTWLEAGLRDMFTRASAMHRRTAAAFLRAHGEHPEVPVVLGRLSGDALRRGLYPEALRLRAMMMRLLGARATSWDHINAAQTCYLALDLACGDAVQARAQTFTGDKRLIHEHTRRLTALKTTGEWAHRAVALRDATDIESMTERGHVLLALGHYREAEALYDGLRERHPQDARPLVGLAKLAIQRDGSYEAARRRIFAARGLQNKDRDFYEVALASLGVLALQKLQQELASGSAEGRDAARAMLADLRAHADGFRRFEPARVAVIEAVVAVMEGVADAIPRPAGDRELELQVVLHRLPAIAGSLAEKFPDSADALRLRLFSATFAEDAATALAWVRQPLTPALAKDPELQRLRARAWLDMTLQWQQEEELPALTRAIEQLPVEAGDRERSTLLAAVLSDRFRKTGDRAAGEQAARIYEEQATAGTNQERTIALNNSGVMGTLLGDTRLAFERFAQVLQLDPTATPALLNGAALALDNGTANPADLAKMFAHVAVKADWRTLRVHARAWNVEIAERGGGKLRAAWKAFGSTLTSEREADLRGTFAYGRWGMLGSGGITGGMGYSLTRGLVLELGTENELWLFLPAPGLDKLLARKPTTKPTTPAGGGARRFAAPRF